MVGKLMIINDARFHIAGPGTPVEDHPIYAEVFMNKKCSMGHINHT